MANPWLRAFADGVIAAASGALAGAVFVLARRSIVDLPTVLILGGAAVLLLWGRRIPEQVVLAAAAAAGLLVAG